MIRKFLLIFLFLMLADPSRPLWSAGGKAVDSYDLEAAYLLHFLEFVAWPSSAFKDDHSSYVIGVVGDDPFGNRLDRLVLGRSINGRKIIIQRFGGFDPTEANDLHSCHILFVAASEKGRLTGILRDIRNSPILTVSEIDKFPLYGGIIEFDQEGKKIKLYLNPDAAKSAKLQVRARLFQVCRIYQGE